MVPSYTYDSTRGQSRIPLIINPPHVPLLSIGSLSVKRISVLLISSGFMDSSCV